MFSSRKTKLHPVLIQETIKLFKFQLNTLIPEELLVLTQYSIFSKNNSKKFILEVNVFTDASSIQLRFIFTPSREYPVGTRNFVSEESILLIINLEILTRF